jgi:hypothetical protein
MQTITLQPTKTYLTPGQQALYDELTKLAKDGQVSINETQLMERLNLKVLDALRTRFENLQAKGAISGYQTTLSQAA